ncbi:MAG: hypothetical protein NTV99_08125 [Deltaproteobacteria bacterium]|nr:hypothetical protein [Deltaproteobacteria bacterium]
MSNEKKKENEGMRISPDELLSFMGRTPADNLEGLSTSYPWKSKMTGQIISALFKQQKTLEAISKDPLHWGPPDRADQSPCAPCRAGGEKSGHFRGHERLDIQELRPVASQPDRLFRQKRAL